VEYFDAPRKAVASGAVLMTYREMKLTCDLATVYMDTKDAYLKGRVRLVQPGGLLKGEEVVYNFETRKGIVLEAEGEAGAWRSKGDRAQKIAGTAFLHRDGYLTSCDFEQPHSRLQAREVHVFMDDKVVLKNAVMYVGNCPVFYLPSYTHPLDDKRPRVTIIPGKDKQWGLFVLTAWRLYLHENLQGRVHVDYRERLDLASGVDLKYELPWGGEGIWRGYYTNERALQRDHLWSRWFHAKKHRQLTHERERFRAQWRHRWDLDAETEATLEGHWMKDPTMVKDFFIREYEKDTSPETYFQIIRSGAWYGLTFVSTKRVNRFETVTQQWPSISFQIRPIRVPWLPVLGRWSEDPKGFSRPSAQEDQEVSLSPEALRGMGSGWYYQSSFGYTHSNEANAQDGTRLSLLRFTTLQELSYPMKLLRWLNLRPFGQFQHTADSHGAVESAPQFWQAAATGFDMSANLYRVFPWETAFWGLDIHRLRHIVTPTLAYKYQAKPTISDGHLRGGGLAKGNTLTPGIEHKFQTKRMKDGQQQTVDLARFLSTIGYDLEGLSGRGGRWGGVTLDLETDPYPWMTFESDAGIDPHKNYGKPQTFNADLYLHEVVEKQGSESVRVQLGDAPPRETEPDLANGLPRLPWFLGMGWRYQRNTSSQLSLETGFNLGRKWRLELYQGFDVKRFVTETSDRGSRVAKKIYDVPEFEYRLRRDLHEWTVDLVYNVQRQQGEALFFVFRLKAAPEEPIEFERHYHLPKAGKNFPKAGEVRK
jgi:hypothetical protein